MNEKLTDVFEYVIWFVYKYAFYTGLRAFLSSQMIYLKIFYSLLVSNLL